MATGEFCRKHTRTYHAHSGAMEIERQWLCLSPTMKKPYRQSCWLLGDPSAMQKEWANGDIAWCIRSYMSECGPIPAIHVCVYPKSVNGVVAKWNNTTHHIIHTLWNTRNIRKDIPTMICDRPERAPNRILSMGPRLRSDATARNASVVAQ